MSFVVRFIHVVLPHSFLIILLMENTRQCSPRPPTSFLARPYPSSVVNGQRGRRPRPLSVVNGGSFVASERSITCGMRKKMSSKHQAPLSPPRPRDKGEYPRAKRPPPHTNKHQVWLAMYHLMCEEECRKRYHFNSMRKNNILRVRKYLNDVLLDQLPVLAAVQRQASCSYGVGGDSGCGG